MNYLAHALPFVDRPYFAAGAAVPDWLAVADRQARVRARQAASLESDPDPRVAAVAGGILGHFRDDARFHGTRAFAETSLELAAAARRVLGPDAGFRASFLGHLLVELLLDAQLAAEYPASLETYYAAIESVDPRIVQDAVNRMAARPTERLAPMISLFCRERILWDYLEDDKLLVRLNQVMRRVGFAPLPESIVGVFPDARQLIRRRRHELWEGIPVKMAQEGAVQ
ncbi:MAG: hypothetical protein ABR915_08355 [Thermoguttaceae bacterium]|jgi:hypothetical protein